ncbi:hypothetical protein DN752_16040 [Echinicola strongylocentroti]|uniref:VTT domain-containing protein n=1 Tax=Echinicola strongylocentroti TaxID=1795355 RepID=A0A2Z4IM97_9BACT|nr:VTT domain-containing protein [Echinicola strongylocentroti]AWW31513.1 hypothetical protein DN752_16040 [Echinicola strongylocentroti]
MARHTAFLSNISSLYQKNPLMALAMLWVMVIPAIGSTMLVSFAYLNHDIPSSLPPSLYLLLILTSTIMMGLALCPTTILAILLGYWWGWTVFPAVIISYSLASLLGYFLGMKLDKNSLALILNNYPKAKQLFNSKSNKTGNLVFFTRISPVIPFALSNLLFAMIKAGWKNILIYGFLGMLPRTLTAFGLGLVASSFAEALDNRTNTFQVVAFVVLLALSVWGISRFFRSPAR